MPIAKSFQDLEVWKLGRKLRQKLYRGVMSLPTHEQYNLATQIQSAAISLTSNIAEGFGRYHYKENAQFCRIARGSACELMDHIMTCRDEGYIPGNQYEELNMELQNFLRVLNAYIKAIGPSKTSFLRE